MSRGARNAALACCAVLALAAGCARVKPSAAGLDPCRLITGAEISQATGAPYAPGVYRPVLGGRCDFHALRGGGEIFLQATDPGLVAALAKLGERPIPGVAAEAYLSGGSIYLRKGRRAVQIGFLQAHPLHRATPAAIRIARLVARRLSPG